MDNELEFSIKEYANSLKYFNFNDDEPDAPEDLYQYYNDLSPKENLKLLIIKEISKKNIHFKNPKVSILLIIIYSPVSL